MDALKKNINDLKTAVQSAKDKQKAAKDECAKLERDMAEFKNNKEGKIDELKVSTVPLLVPCDWPFIYFYHRTIVGWWRIMVHTTRQSLGDTLAVLFISFPPIGRYIKTKDGTAKACGDR